MTRVRRPAALAAGLVLTLGLAAGCGNTEQPPPGADDVPSTLPAKPTIKPQPKAQIKASAPGMHLNGMSRADADQVWQQSLDLVSDWLLNPAFMERHSVTDVHELDGLTKLMTPAAAKLWRKQTRSAFKCYGHSQPGCWRDQPVRQLPIEQLVTYMPSLGSDRGWDNPMLTPVHIDGALVLTANGQFGVIMPIETKYRLIGQGKEYRVPTKSVLGLAWMREGGAWKLSQWWRVYEVDREKLKGWRPGQAPPSDAPATDGPAGQPTAEATLYPE